MGGVDRRTFLKAVGLAVVAPMAVVQAVSSLEAVGTKGCLSGEKVNEYCIKWFQGQPRLDPLTIDGEKFYFMFMHPQQHYDFKVICARDKYKHERWVERYNRWAKTQGKSPYVKFEGETGSWEE